ncbi:hypothetical protein S100892_01329 [Pediococcus pentosaceus]|uniref:Uncharacterized protein n=1 Tax=Pediococcus pentosaceus TaxID=1255 RepID=A0A1Y0VP22_PEDPE|nr:hypothetical protein S100892_01329 [Pediococcus pentosaceus]
MTKPILNKIISLIREHAYIVTMAVTFFEIYRNDLVSTLLFLGITILIYPYWND